MLGFSAASVLAVASSSPLSARPPRVTTSASASSAFFASEPKHLPLGAPPRETVPSFGLWAVPGSVSLSHVGPGGPEGTAWLPPGKGTRCGLAGNRHLSDGRLSFSRAALPQRRDGWRRSSACAFEPDPPMGIRTWSGEGRRSLRAGRARAQRPGCSARVDPQKTLANAGWQVRATTEARAAPPTARP